MTSVFISRAAYDHNLSGIIHGMLDRTATNRMFPGARVLVKPNLLMPAKPSRAIVTHPLVVRAVAEWVLDRGGRVQVSDSPAIGPFSKILKDGGYLDACDGLPITWRSFTKPRQVDIGPPFGHIDLAADAVEADLVINLAKLKTHVMMRLTLGVKNMFGCVIGIKKSRWHLQAGIDRDFFAKLLVQICRAVNPSVTIIDGVLALEGEGPGRSGSPRPVGILAAGRNPVALDFAVARMVGCPIESLPLHQAAVKLGLFDGPPEVVGKVPPIPGFNLPEMGDTGFGPEPVQRLMRKHLLRRPFVDSRLCEICGLCEKKCPAKVITTGKDHIEFNYNRCIRCYCCVEVCPHGALFTMEPLAGKLLRQLKDRGVQAVRRLRSEK